MALSYNYHLIEKNCIQLCFQGFLCNTNNSKQLNVLHSHFKQNHFIEYPGILNVSRTGAMA